MAINVSSWSIRNPIPIDPSVRDAHADRHRRLQAMKISSSRTSICRP